MRNECRDDGAENCGRGNRGNHAGNQSNLGVLQRKPGRIGADTEKGTVAERRQPAVAEQKVVAQRIQAPYQNFESEVLIEPDGAEPQRTGREQREHDTEREREPRCLCGRERRHNDPRLRA